MIDRTKLPTYDLRVPWGLADEMHCLALDAYESDGMTDVESVEWSRAVVDFVDSFRQPVSKPKSYLRLRLSPWAAARWVYDLASFADIWYENANAVSPAWASGDELADAARNRGYLRAAKRISRELRDWLVLEADAAISDRGVLPRVEFPDWIRNLAPERGARWAVRDGGRWYGYVVRRYVSRICGHATVESVPAEWTPIADVSASAERAGLEAHFRQTPCPGCEEEAEGFLREDDR